MAKDPATHFRATNGLLVDAIRISDFKANVAIVFVGIMMGPVIGARDKFPSYFSLAMVMAPFLIIYFCLLLCLLPRYPRMGRANLVIARNADPSMFPPPESRNHSHPSPDQGGVSDRLGYRQPEGAAVADGTRRSGCRSRAEFVRRKP